MVHSGCLGNSFNHGLHQCKQVRRDVPQTHPWVITSAPWIYQPPQSLILKLNVSTVRGHLHHQPQEVHCTELCCRRPSGPGCHWNRSRPVWTSPPHTAPGWDALGLAESPETLGWADPEPAHSRSPCKTPGGGCEERQGKRQEAQPIKDHHNNGLKRRIRAAPLYLHRVGQIRINVFSCSLKQVLTELETQSVFLVTITETQLCNLQLITFMLAHVHLWYDSLLPWFLFAHHGVAFSCTSLSVRKYTHVISWGGNKINMF